MDYSPDTLRTQAEPGMNLPFSLEAEQSVLGAILLEPSCLNVVMDLLPREEYFYAVNNRMIYAARGRMSTTVERQEGSSSTAPSTDCSASRLKGMLIPG